MCYRREDFAPKSFFQGNIGRIVIQADISVQRLPGKPACVEPVGPETNISLYRSGLRKIIPINIPQKPPPTAPATVRLTALVWKLMRSWNNN
jgi:hypothetical protein